MFAVLVKFCTGKEWEIRDFVSRCTICQTYRPAQARVELQLHELPSRPWQKIAADAVPNFCVKQLTAPHPHLLNAYNQAIENPENLPDWFSTAQTYLLPKNKDTENPKNYRPVACWSTSNKVLTSIFAERSYTHITKNHILPEAQRGCVRNSYRFKDQLLINKMIVEDSKKEQRNLSMTG